MNTSTPRYFMATTALGKQDDLSREIPALARIWEETSTHYVGEWVTGIGFINVLFPKETTRELTSEEREYYSSRVVVTAGHATPIEIQPSSKEIENLRAQLEVAEAALVEMTERANQLQAYKDELMKEFAEGRWEAV